MSVRWGLGIFFLCCAALVSAQDLSLEEIIKKNEDALGGAQAINKVQTLKVTAAVVLQAGAQQMETQMTIWAKRPNLSRAETVMQNMLMVIGYDGMTTWMINPATGSSGPQKVDDSSRWASGPSLFPSTDIASMIGSLSGIRAEGNTVELLGKEDVAGSPAFKIKVTPKDGAAITYFIDATTFLPIKCSFSARPGQQIQGEMRFSSYKSIDGIMFAHSRDLGPSGGSGSVHCDLTKLEINVPMDDSLFKMRKADAQPVKK